MMILPFQKELDPRLNSLYKRLNLFRLPSETDQRFADRLGVSVSQFRRWKRNAKGITYVVLSRVAAVIVVDVDWLYTGKGSSSVYSQNGSDWVMIPKGMHEVRLERIESSAEVAYG